MLKIKWQGLPSEIFRKTGGAADPVNRV